MDAMPSLANPFTSWDSAADWLVGTPLRIVVILVGALAVRWVAHRSIRTVVAHAVDRADDHERTSFERMIDRAAGVNLERRRQRALTMGSLLRSTATFVIATIALLTIMAELGVPLAPLLTSAGIGGVALGFGAQSLVKDFLSGIFMIIEDQYGVGDVIDTGEAIGTVEEVSLRVTRLRDASGVVWFIRNGEIVRIGNKSQGWAMATVDIPVASAENPERVIAVLRQVADEVYAEESWADVLLETPTVAGVESVTGGTMLVRLFAKTRPGEQYAVPREIRERALRAFEEAGIRGPVVAPYQGPQI
ncbi:mechanosensitive ion channel protein MscS [Ornithinimicrobium tianjinense]|uniref:Mechanosensitive ion channel protein MscS n=2 Tax=Ornithinimicrobium tianjinense TaxID=1195761 RepID=A0A917BHL9_9MICO|nr:mechanosensitive ion channel protein MscS [Ornithinimicrobium tianjinense]